MFFAFHDPAVLYNWIFHSVLNKADFFHYSTRCPQLLLPEYSRKQSYVFQGPGSGYYNRCGRCLHIHVRYNNSLPRSEQLANNEENFCRASGCSYARCFTGISPEYMAKMNKEDRNNFQKCIEEILEELNLGGRGTAEPLVSERTEEFFDSYKDEAYYSLSLKKRKIVDIPGLKN